MRGLSPEQAIGQLLGYELLSSQNILPDKNAFVCLRPWVTRYVCSDSLCQHMTNGKHLFLVFKAGIQIAKVSHLGTKYLAD